ncbi:alpha/beta fold hydrolase [Terribacillus halophilus]|uniref:alpha/beta fold hydrolase n=1 Tax=Terribacillus halophilus TaxID=361279 RepID=UPI00098607C5|nr:alpha/beta hydrolase [Terribacillus halophilus]
MDITESTIQAGGHKIHYRTAGTGSKVIVLMHGIPTNSFLWVHVIPKLAENYKVIATDMVGFGKSSRASREELTLPKQAEHLIALLDALGVKKATVIGHDLGGGVAQIMAVHHKERVESFMVVDGVAFSNWPLPNVIALRYPTAPEFQPSLFFIEKMMREGTFHQQSLTTQLLAAMLEPFNNVGGPAALQEAAMALNHHQTEDLVPALAEIRLPATFLYGQYDRLLPAYWGEKLHQTVPDSTFKVLPECGHFCMIDNPSLVSEEIMEHMEKIG